MDVGTTPNNDAWWQTHRPLPLIDPNQPTLVDHQAVIPRVFRGERGGRDGGKGRGRDGGRGVGRGDVGRG